MKKTIEEHWRGKLGEKRFDPTNPKDKCYVLSMFPYPSGHLHMGHVRVYTISDAIARFYRLNGKNVFHPMGWDAFGLPAENAAIQRQIPADEWTKQNIEHMKQQLTELGCSFDWQAELATCDPSYYKWTQKLFLLLYNDGLAYQREATVNWDPVDKTVLADEQVDANGCSWRSGAKVEKKLLRQWFIKTSKFAEKLFAGLDDPILQDWRDIVKLQKHWIGHCDGWNFDLKAGKQTITVWSKSPEDFIRAGFIAIKKENLLNEGKIEEGLLDVMVKNPFGSDLPVIVTNEVNFPPFNDTYIGVPVNKEEDLAIADKFGVKIETGLPIEEFEEDRAWVLEKAQDLQIGGDFKVSSKLKDWLISRQRYWGTPIPIIHCDSCGAVPVKDVDLPVKLPELDGNIGQPLNQNKDWLKCACPKCGGEARRESDTMDTFVDSSWYFLRYLDAQNQKELANKDVTKSMMPVDIYIGGKEHAVLHLYYARFFNHFLHQKGFVAHPEPFKRLLVQGMVMGKSFRVKGTGQYLKESEVDIVDAKKGKAVEKSTGKQVAVLWEKMSKSKFNGVDPIDMFKEHGCDTTRLIMLADVAPTSHRNWSDATFPGIINWQRRLWLTVHDFLRARDMIENLEKEDEFEEQEAKLLDAVNYFTSGATFNYKYSHQLSVAVSKMQGLTNSIRKATIDVVAFGKNYERALAAQIIMLAPMAPHFSSELWARFLSADNRADDTSKHINWDGDVFSQKWPTVDDYHEVEFTVKANNAIIGNMKVKNGDLNQMTEEQALFMALNQKDVVKYLTGLKVLGTSWFIYKDYEGVLTIHVDRTAEAASRKAEKAEKQQKSN
jgi:leucyl-tRNA synthetase